MHCLTVLFFMILWMRVLFFSSKVLVRSCFVPFVTNSILTMIRIQVMHASSISAVSLGATLALVMLLLVWQPHKSVEYHTGTFNTMLVEI